MTDETNTAPAPEEKIEGPMPGEEISLTLAADTGALKSALAEVEVEIQSFYARVKAAAQETFQFGEKEASELEAIVAFAVQRAHAKFLASIGITSGEPKA